MLRTRSWSSFGVPRLDTALSQGPGVTARAWVDSTNYQVGDAITIHVLVAHPPAAAIQPPAGDSLGPLVVLQHIPVTHQNDTVAMTGLVVAYYDSGIVTIPPVLVPYAIPGDTAGKFAATNPLMISVHTVAVDTSKAFRDLKPPMSIPITLAEIAIYAGIALAVCGLAYLAYRYWKKRKRGVPASSPNCPRDPLTSSRWKSSEH